LLCAGDALKGRRALEAPSLGQVEDKPDGATTLLVGQMAALALTVVERPCGGGAVSAYRARGLALSQICHRPEREDSRAARRFIAGNFKGLVVGIFNIRAATATASNRIN
jgi:hypothetical protein